jgi:methyl-accepting chemotaxis protein
METFLAMDEKLQSGTVPSLTLHVETLQQRTRRFTRLVTLLTFILAGLLTLILALPIGVLGSWQSEGVLIGTVIELATAAFCWWLAAYTEHYHVAAWLTAISTLTIIILVYWLSPAFALYLTSLILLVIVPVILGRTATVLVFIALVTATFLNLLVNNNDFYAPDGQLVKLGYGSFALWWILLGGAAWLVSFLNSTVQRDNRILNQQATELAQILEELRHKQASSEAESLRVLTLGGELGVIAKQQQLGSQQQVSSLTQVASFVEEMAQAARNIKNQTSGVQESASEISQLSLELQTAFGEVLRAVYGGAESAQRTLAANQQVGLEYTSLREHLTELEQFQGQIRSVVETINSISHETHLLSLNAAIEAAGAGEYGERFGVVANEVKNLAQRAQQSSQQVTEILGRVKNGIEQVVKAADNAQGQVAVVLEAENEIQEVMQQIAGAIDRNGQQVDRIGVAVGNIKVQSDEVSGATNQQSSASLQVAESLFQIKEVAAQNSLTTDHLRQSASNLEQVSASLVATLAMPVNTARED